MSAVTLEGIRLSEHELARFMARITVNEETGCWEFRGALTSGYARFRVRPGLRLLAHRVSYEHFTGPVQRGLQLDHLCRVRHCVNPQHLEPVTPRENVLRGEGACARNARKEKCPRGHDYEWVDWPSGSRRVCRTCQREERREWARLYQRDYRRGLRRKAA